MVKQQKKNIRKKRSSKGFKENRVKASKINASTPYETCTEQLSPFGGLLAVIKFFDLVKFREIFTNHYNKPARQPKLGHYSMVTGILMLLFIGFNRLWHFTYVQLEAILCGFFRVKSLPVASTFWRYMDSMGINQANAFIKIMNILRERVWFLCDLRYHKIHINIDTTVETIYGNQQGGRKGHNTRNRGKKAYRPVLCFIEETREYLLGKLRKGETISGKESADFINKIKANLPGCVKKVLLRADGEFLSWDSVKAAMESSFEFIIANKGCEPVFDSNSWYRPWKRKDVEYNSCIYKPTGWEVACRFVVMRIPKEVAKKPGQAVQRVLFEEDLYTYRIFCTSLTGNPPTIIREYDNRADVENLVGEAKREGLDAIPSAKFKNNAAFFQIVMLVYNIWRYLKILANECVGEDKPVTKDNPSQGLKGIMNNTIRIARLKLLFIAAKVVRHSNVDKIKYSIHDARTPAMLKFLEYLDSARRKVRAWEERSNRPNRYAMI